MSLLRRLCTCLPPLARSFQTHVPKPPPPTSRIQSAQGFLTAIGRSAESKLKVEDWEELWKLDGKGMKKMGLTIQDRRYILWAMEKFRQGEDPQKFWHPEKPKKTVRGRGPAVQNGKRIRSRRHQ
ncbi:hypothetical protein BD410DRAFT_816541 [Rickenella mellea]|uniref:Small ribosomal subunit protein mS41 n=1 Tax=Rickenella mellea TaxID=50990 RepID=A0A4Y7PP98_9AGAM|nr:hypothetical protein BD410DRAFT_816541 [Rickenella mellea]